MDDKLQLFYWPTPNGWKITIALEEMGLPYDLRYINIGAGEQFAPEFLEIAPNNRMPAIIDPDGPESGSISLFESGAILQYLARKTGKFGGRTPREEAEVTQWLMWQMGGLGPMAGQAHHFLGYAPQLSPPQVLPYAQDRYRNEVNRLYGVLNRRLADRDYVAGDFLSIADMAIWPWAILWDKQQQDLSDKPHLTRWLDQLAARPAFVKGRAVGAEKRDNGPMSQAQQQVLFGRK